MRSELDSEAIGADPSSTEHIRKLEAVLRAAQVIESSLDFQTVLESILGSLRDVMPYYLAAVLLPDDTQEALYIAATISPSPEEHRATARIPVGQGVTGAAFSSRAPVVVPAVEAFPGYIPAGEEVRSEAAVPLITGDAVIGVLNVEATEPDAFSPEDVNLLQLFAAQAALAIENARLFQAERHRVAELQRAEEAARRSAERLSTISAVREAIFGGELDEQGVMDLLTESAQRLTRADGAVMLRITGARAHCMAATGRAAFYLGSSSPADDLPTIPSIRTIGVRGSEDGEYDLGIERRFWNHWATGTVASVPLRFQGNVVGALDVLSAETGAFQEQDIQSLLLFAGQFTGLLAQVDRRRTVEALRQSEERYRQLFENAGDIVCTTDLSGNFTSFNQTGQDLLGYSLEEILGMNVAEIVAPEDAGYLRRRISRDLGPQGSIIYETEAMSKDGRRIPMEINARLMCREDKPVGIQAIARDATARKEMEKELRTNETRYRRMFVGNQAIKLLIDPESGIIVDANPAACDFYGYTLKDLKRKRIWDINVLSPEEVAEEMNLARSETRSYFVFRHRLASGDIRDVEVHSSPIEVSGRSLLYSIIHDITERKQAERSLEDAHRFNQEVIANVQEGIVVLDRDSRVVVWNSFLEHLTGISAQEVRGKHVADLSPIVDQYGIDLLISRALNGETVRSEDISYQSSDGSGMRWITASYAPNRDADGTIVGAIGAVSDITERKRAEEALAAQALRDSLTELPNRTLLHDRVRQAMIVATRDGTSFALALMDLDRFKEVNDTFGHHVGDLLLQQVGSRLTGALRQSDTVARLGGDEFAILLLNTDEAGTVLAANKVLSMFKEPFVVEAQSFTVGASIGIALYPRDAEDLNTLLRRADVAMYLAKRDASGYAVYTPGEDEYTPERLALIQDLHQAIEDDHLLVHYQPIVEMKSGSVEQMEALARWEHPLHGRIAPDQFVLLAEHAGLIKMLTWRVLAAAIRQCRSWHDAGFPITVAVNLSTRSLHDQQLTDTMGNLLQASELPASYLRIEITESAMITDPVRSMQTLWRMHDMGVRISIDDFGTGYSSLGYLKRLPVDEVKIDKSFVLDMAANREDASIVRSVIDLGHNLGLRVVAEGTENEEVRQMLADLDCDLAQGYVFSRPLSGEDSTRWLDENFRSHLDRFEPSSQ